MHDHDLLANHRYDSDLVQRVLDAAAEVQILRSRLADLILRGDHSGARIFGVGGQVRERLRAESGSWQHVVSVVTRGRINEVREGLPYNRAHIEGGTSVTSLFDLYGTDTGSRILLSGERIGQYRLGFAPLQLKVVERREVMMFGPVVGAEWSAMMISDPRCLAAANRYVAAVEATSVPASRFRGRFGEQLTDRQRQVVAMLTADATDDQIARALGISSRTVRSDVSTMMQLLGVKSRFALGRRIETER